MKFLILIIKERFYFEKIVKFWAILFFIVTIDVIFELIFGFNTLGFKSYLDGRISSFFGNELVVGTFYHFFSLIVLSYFVKNKSSNFLIIFLILLIIFISFMIGERANFIKLFSFTFTISVSHFEDQLC